MNNIIYPGAGIIFMKVGVHAKEGIEEIIKRKQDEFAKAGMIFWGYGGSSCNPTTHVQPFAKEFAARGEQVKLVMHKMNSKHYAEPELAKEYSDDNLEWKPVPAGIEVRGSRCGMVIGGLTEEEFDLNLKSLIVGIGPSRGKAGNEYIQGQNDKGVFTVINSIDTSIENNQKNIKHIDLYAPLMPPYAVFLR